MPASKLVITCESSQGTDFPYMTRSVMKTNDWDLLFIMNQKIEVLAVPIISLPTNIYRISSNETFRIFCESWPLYTAVAINPSWTKSTEMSSNLLTRRSLFFPYWITCSNNKNWAWLCSIVYGGESGTSAAAGGNVHLLYWRRVWDLPYSSSALQIVRGLLVRVIVT